MEPFEYEDFSQENEYEQPVPQTPEEPYVTAETAEEVVRPAAQPQPETLYRGAGVGRKESPFADSPYVTRTVEEQPQYRQSAYVPPVAPMEPPKKPKAKKARKGLRRVLAAMLVLVLVAGSCGITAVLVNSRWEKETQAMSRDFNTKLDNLQKQIDAAATPGNNPGNVEVTPVYGMTPGQVYARNVQSVVLITCEITTSMYGQKTTGSSTGSGFIISENGYVVTNNHVVDGATTIYVDTHDGERLKAQLVGSDSVNDVAVLKVEAEGLPAVTIGSSSDLVVGDQVVAIGNPLGELTATMTAGYVSAMDRDVTTDGRTINMIQTDAAINSGNSGGPLFNMKGEVVGITTAKYSGSSSSGASIEGIGFAIPMDDVIGMVEDLVNFGYVTGAYLGVMVSDMDTEIAAYYGMPVGAYVEEVTSGYCAEEAGLRAKDIIVALGEYEVKNISTLTRALRNFKAGDTTTITVYRGGEKIQLPITLDEKPVSTTQEEIPQEEQMPQNGDFNEWYDYFFGYRGD